MWTFDFCDKNIKWGTTEYDQMWFNISKYQLYQYKRKTDQNRASERFLRLTKHGPCQSRARLEWRVAVSAVNHFAIFSPRLPWPSAGRNWIFDTDSHKSMVSIVRPFIGLSHCHAKVCFFYKFKCLIFKWVSFLVSDTWLCLRYVTFLYPPAPLFRVIFPYFKYKYYNCIFFRLFIQ